MGSKPFDRVTLTFYTDPMLPQRKKPIVSILMRTRDRSLFLPRALSSVLNQTYSDWQLVVINDGGDRSVLSKTMDPFFTDLKGRLKILHHRKSKTSGIGSPLNLGIRSSESRFLAVHDDDDSWHPAFLETTLKKLEEPHWGGCVTKCNKVLERIEGDEVKFVKREIYNDWQRFGISLFRLAENNSFAPISLVFRRAVLKTIGHRNDALGPLEDWDFNLRLLSHFPLAHLPEVLANYHLREECSENSSNANFFTKASDLYGKLDIEFRNEKLREDFSKGKTGLGFLLGLSQMKGRLYQKLQELEPKDR